jgi:transposase-like protein
VAGVSTRKVDQLDESLGLRISKSEVSRICAGLDEQVVRLGEAAGEVDLGDLDAALLADPRLGPR